MKNSIFRKYQKKKKNDGNKQTVRRTRDDVLSNIQLANDEKTIGIKRPRALGVLIRK